MLSGKPAALAILTVKHGGASIIFSNIYGNIFLKPNPFVELSPGCLHDAVLDMFSNKLWILPRRCVFNSFFFFFQYHRVFLSLVLFLVPGFDPLLITDHSRLLPSACDLE